MGTSIPTFRSALSMYHGEHTVDVKKKGTHSFIVSFTVWKRVGAKIIRPNFLSRMDFHMITLTVKKA